MTPTSTAEDIARVHQELVQVIHEIKTETDPIKKTQLRDAKYTLSAMLVKLRREVKRLPASNARVAPSVSEAYVDAINTLNKRITTLRNKLSNQHLSESAGHTRDFVEVVVAVNAELDKLISTI